MVVVVRDRWSMAVESLASVIGHTADDVGVVVVSPSDTPRRVAAVLRDLVAGRPGARIVDAPRLRTPNEARNIGARAVSSTYVAFVDNDVIVEPGWLDALVSCGTETGADIVAPLVCEGWPPATRIHHAGGRIVPEGAIGWFDAPGPRPYVTEMFGHHEPLDDWRDRLERSQTGSFEFHAALVRSALLRELGGLDERLLGSREHLDLSLAVLARGGSIVFEPRSVVTYVHPGRHRPLRRADVGYFLLRWSDEWLAASAAHFAEKWRLLDPVAVEGRRAVARWRRNEAVWTSLVSRVPVVGSSPRWRYWATRALRPVDRAFVRTQLRRRDRQSSARTR